MLYAYLFRAKYLEQGKEIKYDWTGLKVFDICPGILIDYYCQSIICESETRY